MTDHFESPLPDPGPKESFVRDLANVTYRQADELAKLANEIGKLESHNAVQAKLVETAMRANIQANTLLDQVERFLDSLVDQYTWSLDTATDLRNQIHAYFQGNPEDPQP